MRIEIKGEKVVLKKFNVAFTELLFNSVIESRSTLVYWLPWCHENYSIKDSEDFIKKSVENWEDKTQFAFAVFDTESNEFLGGVGLNKPDFANKFYNLGYWTKTSLQNRGIASEAARLLARTAFEDLDINRIEIIVAKENIPSQKAAEKAGAKREGILRKRLLIGDRIHDAVMFSFIKEDF